MSHPWFTLPASKGHQKQQVCVTRRCHQTWLAGKYHYTWMVFLAKNESISSVNGGLATAIVIIVDYSSSRGQPLDARGNHPQVYNFRSFFFDIGIGQNLYIFTYEGCSTTSDSNGMQWNWAINNGETAEIPQCRTSSKPWIPFVLANITDAMNHT